MTDYSFYTDTYHGSLIPEEEFPFWLGRADARLEELTFGRCFGADLPAAVQTRVSLAECAIADALFSVDSASAALAAAYLLTTGLLNRACVIAG